MALRLLIATCAVLLLACGTLRTYDGPARTSDQIALLRPARAQHLRAFILAVDGKPLSAFQDRVEVLPGEHEVEASALLTVGGQVVNDKRLLHLLARSGCEYVVHAPTVSNRKTASCRHTYIHTAPSDAVRPYR